MVQKRETHMTEQPMKPVKFNFEAGIVRRRKVRFSTIITGLLAGAALGYGVWSFIQFGVIPALERFIRQLGLIEFQTIFYAGLAAILFFFTVRMLYLMLRKKTVIGGTIAFDEENLKIVKGREKYVIPEAELNHLKFELKPLSETKKASSKKIKGGNFMKIPTKSGTFNCELDIRDQEQLNQLLSMVEFLKIEHDVEVKVSELKK